MQVAVGRLATLATLVISVAVVAGMVSHRSAPAPLRPPYQPAARGTPIDHVAVIGDSYTTGTDEGGQGSNAWTTRTWLALAHQGVQIAPNVASEGRAGYVVRGDHGSVFEDLTGRAVHPDDALVVFFGSRNDQGVDPMQMVGMAHDTFTLARSIAPTAKLLVIGPAVADRRPTVRRPVRSRHSERSGPCSGGNVHRPDRRGLVRRQARPDRSGWCASQRRRTCLYGGENRATDSCPIVQVELTRRARQRVSRIAVPGTKRCT